MDYKKTDASQSTQTRDVAEITQKSGNIYKSLAIMAKRSNQISSDIKEELTSKKECENTNGKFSGNGQVIHRIYSSRSPIYQDKVTDSVLKSE